MSDQQTTALPVADSASSDVCSLWASPEEAFDCCEALTESDTDKMEWALAQASNILYRLSGHQYPGICQARVRPPRVGWTSCWFPDRSAWHDDGCVMLSSVRLAGYPVQEILEVEIDGEVLDASEYTVYRRRELVRMADAQRRRRAWPSCQRMDIASGVGTFFVTYKYGLNPPVEGVGAAAQLACEIAKQCRPGGGGATEDCAIPEGTVRIARQGITIDTQSLGLWLLGQMRTGMPLVDVFLSVYGRPRDYKRVALSVPEMDSWPVRVY